ncbi:uncharacterized protein LOC127867806 isoform X2 [Dreissena polymorpha]|uniref:uncharacterized protein LOC127867806 isoform X2 n=1 Tax=Dreissena polymorpha TaxID=45954 RepID=UPI002263D1CB|nr:uncharacterized protein LOC127867806 isoform X2 [Dreissena polymorpha]
MSDSDNPPELVDSSEEEGSGKTASSLAEKWLNKDRKFLTTQESWMRIFCFCPFLFGCNNVVSKAWIRALINVKLILNESRQYEITYFEWPEWECLDLLDFAVKETQKTLRNPKKLKEVLECAEILEECKSGVIIDDTLAIEAAEKSVCIAEIWGCVLKHENAIKRAKAAKFAVLYIIKIYREHVVHTCEKKLDFVDVTLKEIRKPNANKLSEEHKKQGNASFNNADFEEAIKCYSEAAKNDPVHHVYYGNRALAYIKVKKFKEALADSRRAVILKPDFPKGHHRYALAFYELGQLDSAIRVNKAGQVLCRKSQDEHYLAQLREQEGKYMEEKKRQHNGLTPIPKDLDKKLSSVPQPATDLNEKLGCKVPKVDREDDIPDLVQSDHDSSDTSTSEDDYESDSAVSSDNSKTKPVVKESEKVLVNPEEEMKKKQEEQRQLLKSQMREGSQSYSKQAYKPAFTSYGKALEMVKQTEDLALFEMDEEDLVALKYAYAMAAINTGVSRNITEGMDKLYAINTTHENVKFPAVHYGFAKAYVMFNRYADGLRELESAERIASKVRYPQVTWPGTSELIADTTPEGLQAKISELVQVCKCPPPPDAICRYHTSKLPFDELTTIYLADPDFKGYFKMVCQMDCVVSFHMICWKDYKTSQNKQNDKDILDTKCPTPDCQGHIIKIHVIRPDSTEKEYVSDKYTTIKENQKNKKQTAKQKPTNEQRITRKKEQKDKRRHKRQEHSQCNSYAEPEVEIVDGASAVAFIEDIETPEYTLPCIKNTTVLKRDKLNDNKSSTSNGKAKKARKKKDKSKQILNVEVNFTDGKEDKLLSEKSVLSDEESNLINEANIRPFSVPKQLQKDVAMFENTYAVTVKANKPDEVTENLFSFFAEILEASGPMPINDPQLQQEMDVFPFEAIERIKQVGGLGDFLKQSLKFAVIDDVVSILSHAKAARELALKRRHELGSSGVPAVANDWYTVGKSVNNVDSLTESVKVSMDYSSKVSGMTGVLDTGKTHSKISPSNSMASVPQFSVGVAISQPSPSSFSTTYPHWSEGVNSFNINSQKQPGVVNSFDLIDNPPLIGKTVKPSMDELDDIDIHSDAYSDFRGSQDSGRVEANGNSKLLPDSSKNEKEMSRSSSKSDVSERSELSGFSIDAPKPLKPLRSHILSGKNQINNLDKPVNSPVSWSSTGKGSLEDSDILSDSVFKEIQKVGEEYVKKTDAELIAELAASVVNQIYNGKSVSKQDRSDMLERVSADIARDFEKNDTFRKQGLWTNTPASSGYTDKFAMDFMKKHYETPEVIAPPTSVYPQHRLSVNSKEFTPKQFSNFNSLFNEPLSTGSNGNGHFLGTNLMTESAGYTLFSGPSLGIGKFSTPITTSASFIPPPMSASNFYSSELPPNLGIPGRMPLSSPSMWPPFSQTPNPISMPLSTSTENRKTYVHSVTMTDDNWDQELLKLQEERDQALARIRDIESLHRKLQEDNRAKDTKIMDLESQIQTQQTNYEREVTSWLHQKTALRQELQKTQDTLQGREKQEAELREKMATQEIRVKNIDMLAKDQREKDISTMKQIKERSEYFQQNYESQQERARAAEIEILTIRRKDRQGVLDRAIEQATLNVQRMAMFKQKYMEEQKTVPPLLEQGMNFWTFYINKAKESVQQIQRDYGGQMEEIKQGKQLSELPEVPAPSLPDVPEGLQKSMQLLQHGFMMSGMHGLDPIRGAPYAAAPSLPATTGNAVVGPVVTSASNNTMAVAPNGAMPKPLRPPGLTPRPLSSLHKGLPGLQPQRAPLRPIGKVQQPMSSFEKLVSKLQTVFPGKSRPEVSVWVQELRQSRGGSLSGLTIEDITRQVVTMIQARDRKPLPPNMPSAPPPGISRSWAFTSYSGVASHAPGPSDAGSVPGPSSGAGGGEGGLEMYQEETEDPCVICHEEMDSLPVVTLKCGHVFHDQCIRKWFQEQSTCPNCRVHALLADEFPSLT